MAHPVLVAICSVAQHCRTCAMHGGSIPRVIKLGHLLTAVKGETRRRKTPLTVNIYPVVPFKIEHLHWQGRNPRQLLNNGWMCYRFMTSELQREQYKSYAIRTLLHSKGSSGDMMTYILKIRESHIGPAGCLLCINFRATSVKQQITQPA